MCDCCFLPFLFPLSLSLSREETREGDEDEVESQRVEIKRGLRSMRSMMKPKFPAEVLCEVLRLKDTRRGFGEVREARVRVVLD